VFPHWNWQPGKVVDVWAYYNQADEVELFLNGTSLGVKRKEGDDLHVMWRVPFEAGTLKAVSRKNGNTVMEREVKTAGNPVSVVLEADKASYESAANDLAFVTVKIVDENGTVVPDASNLVEFKVDGGASVKAVDNGDPVSHESFIDTKRKTFHGLALVVIQKNGNKGDVRLTAKFEGLPVATVLLKFE
jgi:beta-galactosidase